MTYNQEPEAQEDKMIHIRLEPATYNKFKAVTALENKSMTQCVGELIERFLKTKQVSLMISE